MMAGEVCALLIAAGLVAGLRSCPRAAGGKSPRDLASRQAAPPLGVPDGRCAAALRRLVSEMGPYWDPEDVNAKPRDVNRGPVTPTKPPP